MHLNKQINTSNTPLDLKVYTASVFQQMKEELAALSPANKLQKAGLSFQVAREAATALKQVADNYHFESEAEEIAFYKTSYAEILEEVYYFGLKYEFEAHSPYKGFNEKAAYLQDSIIRHKSDLEKQLPFYNYSYLDESHLDAKYFCHDSDMPTPPDIAIGFSSYSAPCDYYAHKFARIQALIRHINELHLELTGLNDDGVIISPKSNDNGLVWTGPKVALIELAYALCEHGSINKGDVTLKRIINGLEATFNIRLDNYATIFFQDIRLRKDNRAKFLAALTVSLVNRMDRLDEKPARQ